MSLKNNEVICSVISVDCVENDIQDIRMGGHQYIGYDFAVNRDEAVEMELFILKTLEKYGVPVVNIYVSNKAVVKTQSKVWTKERIDNCIKNNEACISDLDLYPTK